MADTPSSGESSSARAATPASGSGDSVLVKLFHHWFAESQDAKGNLSPDAPPILRLLVDNAPMRDSVMGFLTVCQRKVDESIAELRTQLQQRTAEVGQLNATVTSRTTELQTQLNQRSLEVATLKGELTRLQESIGQAGSEANVTVSQLRQQLAAAAQEKANLDDRVSQLRL